MKSITSTSLEELRQKEKEIEMKEQQLQAIGIELAQEKIKNAQKDSVIQMLGREVAMLKIEVMTLKEGEA
ncbi:D-alanyl-D-alanine carboxypeptidase [Bacillus sp. CGMCC 1.16541]|uniref:XkdW family protein n=1 Tax=Bacillus sp. CGMCC 1.16541 TaxID=2185143 RepID=UPI000D738AE1|nr:D-alanyl-D-alanine carboxypeptidase [Bacillus sp. CGMCC 1.16541]